MGLEEKSRGKYQNFNLWECTQGKDKSTRSSNDPHSIIQKKLEEKYKKFNDMKDNIKMLKETTTANYMTIQLQDA